MGAQGCHRMRYGGRGGGGGFFPRPRGGRGARASFLPGSGGSNGIVYLVERDWMAAFGWPEFWNLMGESRRVSAGFQQFSASGKSVLRKAYFPNERRRTNQKVY